MRLQAIKNVTINEPFFQGHFPGVPIMPGVLVIEAMAQAGAVLMLSEMEDRESRLAVFTGIEKAKFRRQVTPGDQLRIEAKRTGVLRCVSGRMEAKAFVGEKMACEAILTCQIVPKRREAVAAPAGTEAAAGEPPGGGVSIHPSAVIAAGAVISESCEVGAVSLHHRARGCAGRGVQADFARGAGRSYADRGEERVLSVLFGWGSAAGFEVQGRADADGNWG